MILYTRGKGAKRRVAHLPIYSRRTGDIEGAVCGAKYNTSCNLGLGLRLCKRCRTLANPSKEPQK